MLSHLPSHHDLLCCTNLRSQQTTGPSFSSSKMNVLFVCFSFTLWVASTHGFQTSGSSSARAPFALHMAPRYDKKNARWMPTSSAEGPEAGYGIGKTLLLRGPKPFLHRLFQPDDYEQAVLKCEYGNAAFGPSPKVSPILLFAVRSLKSWPWRSATASKPKEIWMHTLKMRKVGRFAGFRRRLFCERVQAIN